MSENNLDLNEKLDENINENIEKKTLDKKYKANEKEEKWNKSWEKSRIYKFEKDDREIFSIDTPPPTISGDIHIGHIFSYSQTEMIARFKRLMGYNVFYPFGFDDNGLPTERLVEKEYKVKAHQIGREEFNKLCYEITEQYGEKFKNLFTKLGIGTDWDMVYSTISPDVIKISQSSFLDLVEKGYCYHKKAPALWCKECVTSIAQAELETKTVKTDFNYIRFKTEDGEEFEIATTRPELLPAIVAVFVNPDDEENTHLIGKTAIIPVVDLKVPILADDKVEQDKGSGIVMCCTFGDQTDIYWYNKHRLDLRYILTPYGKLIDDVPNYGGLTIKQAREKIVEDLDKAGVLIDKKEIEHEVQVHERCSKDVEYSLMEQWFIDTTSNKEKFLEMGNKINWYPEYMKVRYEEWVENIAWDWGISRQRYFGVPFPVWYCEDCGETILARKEDLPVNPLKDNPPIDKCPNCGHTNFTPESDVLDTWATSSVTPEINARWGLEDEKKYLLPMSIRTNGSDIIRTWDFYSIVKSFYHHNDIPWKDLAISGFVMADKGEKISKRKGNSKFEPDVLLEQFSADIVRYWAGTGRIGTDIIFSEETLRRGKKLVNKIWNVSKFIEMHLKDYDLSLEETKKDIEENYSNLEFFDKWILAKYMKMEKQFLNYMNKYEVGLGLNVLEKFFWSFCDNYIEIVKHRLYRPEEFSDKARFSGQKTIFYLLFKLLQNYSIFFPYIAEEIFSVIYEEEFNKSKSIHLTKIEKIDLDENKNNNDKNNDNINKIYLLGEDLVEILGKVRGEKTDNNVSLKTEVSNLDLKLNKDLNKALEEAKLDFTATLFIKNLNIEEYDESLEEPENIYNIDKIELNLEKE